MFAALLTFAGCCGAKEPNSSPTYFLQPDTVSPDGHYGVLVPHFGLDEPMDAVFNKVVDLGTSEVIAIIAPDPSAEQDADIGYQNPTGWDRSLNHHEQGEALWSPDSSILLWSIESKWGKDGLVLMKFSDGKLAWRRDVLSLCRKAIITRMRKAAPKEFAAGTKANHGSGAWYPRGYAVQQVLSGRLQFPVRFTVGATSNVKSIENFVTVEANLRAEVDADGVVTVTSFAMGPGKNRVFGH
jgi:hypothetical protein